MTCDAFTSGGSKIALISLEIMNSISPGVYPFLSILALREIGPEVQNQQHSVLSFVPACGDWKKEMHS